MNDLTTESNKNQPYKIPVYVLENETVDLPLNDQVLLSFNQGSIRSYIESGLIEGHVVSSRGEAKVWVAPEGDDQNPGTSTAPFASIQYAIDTLVDRVGHSNQKTIKIRQGEYEGNIFINTRNLEIEAERGTILRSTESPAPPVIITPATERSVIEDMFEGGDGLSFEINSEEYQYTGEPLSSLNVGKATVNFGGNVYYEANVGIHNLLVVNEYHNITIALIGAGGVDYCNGVRLVGVGLSNTSGTSEDTTSLWIKDFDSTHIENLQGGEHDQAVLDGGSSIIMEGYNPVARKWIVNYDDPTSQGKFLGSVFAPIVVQEGVELFGRTYLTGDGASDQYVPVTVEGDIRFYTEGGTVSNSQEYPSIRCSVFHNKSDIEIRILNFHAQGLIHDSEKNLLIEGGTIEGGVSVENIDGTLKLKNVVIEGQLTVNGSIDFTNVVVTGGARSYDGLVEDGGKVFVYPGQPTCYIDGAFYSDGEENPANFCEICNPAADPQGWVPRDNGSICPNDGTCNLFECQEGQCVDSGIEDCDDGNPCTTNSCVSNSCETSNVAQGTSCGTGGECTNEVCDGSGECIEEVSSGCYIDQMCYDEEDVNPNNRCFHCDSNSDDSEWTYRFGTDLCAEMTAPPRTSSGVPIMLDAGPSVNPGGGEVQYNWVQQSGPNISFSDATQPVLYFTPPRPYFGFVQYTMVFELEISSGSEISEPVRKHIQVTR